MAEIDILSINNKKIQDVEARKDIQVIKENQINLIEDDTSMEGISDTVHDTLETDDKRIIGGINEVNAKLKEIANKTIIEDGKLYLVKSDGTKLDEGTILPINGGGSDTMFEEVSSVEDTIDETVDATALLQGTIGCGSPLAYDNEGNIIAYDEGNDKITKRNYQNGVCNLAQSGEINYDSTK